MHSELMTLRTLVRKKLQRHSATSRSVELLVEGDILLQAVAAGLSVKGDITLRQLSDIVDSRLQAEVLATYQAWPGHAKKAG